MMEKSILIKEYYNLIEDMKNIFQPENKDDNIEIASLINDILATDYNLRLDSDQNKILGYEIQKLRKAIDNYKYMKDEVANLVVRNDAKNLKQSDDADNKIKNCHFEIDDSTKICDSKNLKHQFLKNSQVIKTKNSLLDSLNVTAGDRSLLSLNDNNSLGISEILEGKEKLSLVLDSIINQSKSVFDLRTSDIENIFQMNNQVEHQITQKLSFLDELNGSNGHDMTQSDIDSLLKDDVSLQIKYLFTQKLLNHYLELIEPPLFIPMEDLYRVKLKVKTKNLNTLSNDIHKTNQILAGNSDENAELNLKSNNPNTNKKVDPAKSNTDNLLIIFFKQQKLTNLLNTNDDSCLPTTSNIILDTVIYENREISADVINSLPFSLAMLVKMIAADHLE